jgi:hypothetical protein
LVVARLFSSLHRPELFCGPPSLLSDGYRWLFPRGQSDREREADHSLQTVDLYIHFLTRLHGAMLNYFTFTLRNTQCISVRKCKRLKQLMGMYVCISDGPEIRPLYRDLQFMEIIAVYCGYHKKHSDEKTLKLKKN